MSILHLVATPIGNLDDISARALRTLTGVQLIAAEDTRHTQKLLTRYGIRTTLTSYHDHNKALKLDHILAALETGDIALVSDAGTPSINDPGYELVRAALAAGHTVSPVPGPSAPIAALAASGLPTDSFLYLGYLPRKAKARRDLLAANAHQPHTLIFLEAPHRLPAALADLEAVLGNRQIAVARELTKLHEEIVRGTLREVRTHFEAAPPRGEITLVVAGKSPDEDEPWTEAKISAEIQVGIKNGESASALAKRLAIESGWKKREIYALINLT